MPKHLPLADPAGEYATPIPAAVKAAAAKADALHAQHYGKTPAEPASPANPDLVVLTPPADAPAPATPATPAAAAPAEPVIPVTPAATPAEPTSPEGFVSDRAYKGMKGRFERASTENLQLREHIRDLQAAVDTLQRAREAAPAAPVQDMSPQDLEEYGPDMVAMVKRVAASMTKELTNEIADLKNKLGQVSSNTTKVTRASMLADLTKEVPNWQELDSNQSFLDWLALPDELSGAIRHNLLTNAYQQNDAARVARFFKGFLAEEAARNPAPSPGVVPPAALPPATPQIGLETLAAPGRAKSTAPGTSGPVEKPIISRADIAAFYANKQRGHYTPAQIAEYEAELFAAQREGRIRN